MFFRDQRVFVNNSLNLNFLTEDQQDSICEIQVANVLEILAYLEPTDDITVERVHLFQPDILIKSVVFNEGIVLTLSLI